MPSTPTEANTLNLTALIERLEKADGPSRELDARIHAAVFPKTRFMTYGGDTRTKAPATYDDIGNFDFDKWAEVGDTVDWDALAHMFGASERYSASIDAAVALAERVVAMEGRKLICFFCAGGQLTPYNADETSPDYHPKAKIDNSVTAGWMAHVAFYNSDGATGHDDYSHGRTAPLAICLATLRALSAQEGSPDA